MVKTNVQIEMFKSHLNIIRTSTINKQVKDDTVHVGGILNFKIFKCLVSVF